MATNKLQNKFLQPKLVKNPNLFDNTSFKSNSGVMLPWKVECEALTDADWEWVADRVIKRFSFCGVVGVPTGGNKLEKALKPYIKPDGDVFLIVDDVLTTGGSMENIKEKTKNQHRNKPRIGIVLFSRITPPSWIISIWQYW